jgi:hypothetical protein
MQGGQVSSYVYVTLGVLQIGFVILIVRLTSGEADGSNEEEAPPFLLFTAVVGMLGIQLGITCVGLWFMWQNMKTILHLLDNYQAGAAPPPSTQVVSQ